MVLFPLSPKLTFIFQNHAQVITTSGDHNGSIHDYCIHLKVGSEETGRNTTAKG